MQERAAWLQNFENNLIPVAAMLGILPADLASLNLDVEDFVDLAATMLSVESYKASVREYRNSLTEGRIGDPTPVFPTENFDAPPNAPRPAGMFQRLSELVDRIRSAPAYTDEIGASLGILVQPLTELTPEELKPAIKASESFSMYKFFLNVTRMGMPQFKVQVQRDGSTTWTDVGFGTSNPIEVTISPTTAGQPERILVRAVLMEKNVPVGEPSDPTFVTVNP
jgi:hypothetical protein